VILSEDEGLTNQQIADVLDISLEEPVTSCPLCVSTTAPQLVLYRPVKLGRRASAACTGNASGESNTISNERMTR
jgi:hypothetical protein